MRLFYIKIISTAFNKCTKQSGEEVVEVTEMPELILQLYWGILDITERKIADIAVCLEYAGAIQKSGTTHTELKFKMY
jgi:hypothetical protein